MKKLILSFGLSLLTISSFSQDTLTFNNIKNKKSYCNCKSIVIINYNDLVQTIEIIYNGKSKVYKIIGLTKKEGSVQYIVGDESIRSIEFGKVVTILYNDKRRKETVLSR